jgi:hypothetical protein
MTAFKVASLSVGLLGLFVIIKALPIVQSLIYALLPKASTGVTVSHPDQYRLYLLINTLITISFGSILIASRRRIGKFLLNEDQPVTGESMGLRNYQHLAFSVLGIYFVVHGSAGFFGRLLPFLSQGDRSTSLLQLWPAGIELVLGLCLFFGFRGIVWVWERLGSEWKSEDKLNQSKSKNI